MEATAPSRDMVDGGGGSLAKSVATAPATEPTLPRSQLAKALAGSPTKRRPTPFRGARIFDGCPMGGWKIVIFLGDSQKTDGA